MKIAILGWGSVGWDKHGLSAIGEWQTGGPLRIHAGGVGFHSELRHQIPPRA